MCARRSRSHAIPSLSAIGAKVLSIIWEQTSSATRDIHMELLKQEYIPYMTVHAALERLTERGMLKRRKQSKAFVFSTEIGRMKAVESIVDSTIDELLSGSPLHILEYLNENKLTDTERIKLAERLGAPDHPICDLVGLAGTG
jgi:predicted transcriptional regulator